MVAVRIEGAAKTVGAATETVESAEQAEERLAAAAVDVIAVDLALPGLNLKALAATARERGAVIVGFYPHVDAELRRSAKAAGIEKLYARSKFLRETATILREVVEK